MKLLINHNRQFEKIGRNIFGNGQYLRIVRAFNVVFFFLIPKVAGILINRGILSWIEGERRKMDYFRKEYKWRRRIPTDNGRCGVCIHWLEVNPKVEPDGTWGHCASLRCATKAVSVCYCFHPKILKMKWWKK